MRARRLLAAGLAAATMFTVTPSADAAVATVGRVIITRHRRDIPAQGGIRVVVGLEADRNSKGQTTRLRSRASMQRISKTVSVQIDRVRLQKAGTTVKDVKTPVRTTGGGTITLPTGWVSVPAGSCATYRTVANFTVKWVDGGTSTFSETSPATRVCGPPKPAPTKPANPGNTKNCSDFRTWAEANAWFQKYLPYYGDVAKLDADNDGIPCETLR